MSVCVCIRSSGTGVTDSCELPCGYWKLKLDPLEELPVLLTTEPSVQLCYLETLFRRFAVNLRNLDFDFSVLYLQSRTEGFQVRALTALKQTNWEVFTQHRLGDFLSDMDRSSLG